MTGKTKTLSALLLSFAVYLFPLIGPHAVFLLGPSLFQEFIRRERNAAWIATDIAFALIVQLSTFTALFWLFTKPSKSRVAVVAAMVPLLGITVEVGYLVFIPSRFLIENDTAGERSDWPVECTAREVGLVDITHPSNVPAWSEFLVQSPDGTYQLMHLPGCGLTSLGVPQPTVQPGGRVDYTISLAYFVPGRGLIFSKQETATAKFTWNVFSNGQVKPIPGLHPSAAPILSTDGQWAAWLERESIAIEHIDGTEAPLQVNLPGTNLWTYTLRSVDMQSGEIELVSSDRRVVAGLDGNIKNSGAPPFQWDRYRDEGPPRVSWIINGQSVTHNVLKGRSINSAAMTPSGDLVAVSVGTALNIGQIRDSLYVLRAADQTEVFRRYLSTYTRTPVYFPTDDLMVYTADREVDVVRVRR